MLVLSTGVYGSKIFSLLLFKYWSNVQTVSEKKFCLGPKKMVGVQFLTRDFHYDGRVDLGPAFPVFTYRYVHINGNSETCILSYS